MEYEILVNRYGYVLVYKRYTETGALRFIRHARSIPEAIAYCAALPTTIVRSSRRLVKRLE